MRKLPLLIIAIICVHIGFVAYMSSDRQAEIASEEFNKSSRRIVPVPNSSYELPGSAQSKPDDSSVASTAAEVESSERSRVTGARVTRQFRSSVGSRSYPSKRPLTAIRKIPAFPTRRDLPIGTDTNALQKPADVTILYPDPGKSVERKLDGRRVATKMLPKRENRSLVARVFVPIFKKPYGWIKAIGSKLN